MKPMIIAHRGASGYAPENTMAAFSKGIELGADAIELDVNQTADGEIVVIHDATLRRTTNGRGRAREHTLAELRLLDAGGWFGKEYSGERISTLQEVLQWASARTRVWIEIKDAAAQKVLAIVKKEQALDRVVIFSMHVEAMENLIDAPVERSLVFPRWSRKVRNIKSLCALASELKLRSIAPHFSVAKRRFVEQMHDVDLDVAVWTANRKGTIRRLVCNGVDAIITNYPDRAKEIAEALAKP